MQSIFKTLAITLTLLFAAAPSASAAQRIFYEDCEATSFSEYFLERHYGTTYSSYWDELTSELTRSTTAHGGSYSMTYDPWVDGNPHAVVGAGDVNYGNTSKFDLSNVNGRYWYFRWYQRWESGQTYSGENKLLYINSSNHGDFTFTFKKKGPDDFHITVLRNDGYTYISNPWPAHSGGSLDDEQWHKMEVYIDAGTSGDANGHYWIEIDDILLYEKTGLTFNSKIASNPVHMITGWPSNVSSASGSQQTWLDDLEIYLLNGPNDIPGDTKADTILPAPENLRLAVN